MSATSGIGVSPELTAEFSSAVESKNVRFLKVSIKDESLIHDLSVPVDGTLSEDLNKLSSPEVLQDDIPAYILTKLDDPPAEWLVIYYVPDSAKVRDKMLYASSRNSLLRSLGSTLFTDTIFATSKADLTPEAYAAHLRSVAAPKPMSEQEKEMATVRAAERKAGGVTYEASHVRSTPSWKWDDGVEEALKELDEGEGTGLVVLTVDSKAEGLLIKSTGSPSADELGAALPQDEPCYAFFAWPHTPGQRDIVFIYSCPSQSPVKFRMIYSSGALTTHLLAKSYFTTSTLVSRKVETSDPMDLNEAHLKAELGIKAQTSTAAQLDSGEKKPFAKPKGPPRRR
ncbi:hypothetical protein CPB85DRAFT_1278538 [Mucidula mucida]|nr:hypothetical protein CPB85DRAFT_1278538 [Mucidula mucida]